MDRKPEIVRQLLDDSSFIRWAMGESPSWEAAKWDKWVQESELHRSAARKAQAIISGFEFSEPEPAGVQKHWENVREKITARGRARRLRGSKAFGRSDLPDTLAIVFKTAAVLLVGAFAALAMYIYQETAVEQNVAVTRTVQTDYGEKITIQLSDLSTIILAPGSKLSYRENWLDEPTKRVKLDGEAYFSIAPQKGLDRPKFVVETVDGFAAVWGTRFTVNTQGTGTRVVLQEGEVRVKVADTEIQNKSGVTMNQGQMARFTRKNATVDLKRVDPRVYTSWITSELYFEDTPLSFLVDRIERTYGVRVEVRDTQILNKKLSGSVDFRSLEGLINAVSEVLDIRIQQTEKNGDDLLIITERTRET